MTLHIWMQRRDRAMKLFGNIVLGLVGLASLTVLVVSITPGVLNDMLFFALMLSCLVVPLLMIVGTIVLIRLSNTGRLKHWKQLLPQAGIAIAILMCTFVLLKFYVPRRIAFAASRFAFQNYIDQADHPDTTLASLDKRFGFYNVDKYATDLRGGHYFRVYSGQDGMGPDVMSYGFCHQPNANGTPFGASGYRTYRLGNGWFWFRASDDSY